MNHGQQEHSPREMFRRWTVLLHLCAHTLGTQSPAFPQASQRGWGGLTLSKCALGYQYLCKRFLKFKNLQLYPSDDLCCFPFIHILSLKT